jgi:hypothetical protein
MPPDNLELRRDAVKRFTLATRGQSAADRVASLSEDDLRRAERQIEVEARNIKPASPPAVAAPAPQPPPAADGKVTEDQYVAMSPAERIVYARQFPPPPLDAGRR